MPGRGRRYAMPGARFTGAFFLMLYLEGSRSDRECVSWQETLRQALYPDSFGRKSYFDQIRSVFVIDLKDFSIENVPVLALYFHGFLKY